MKKICIFIILFGLFLNLCIITTIPVTAQASETKIFYFDDYDIFEAWAITPQDMVDNSTVSRAITTSQNDIELLTNNTCSYGVNFGTITKVELRAYGKVSTETSLDVELRPVFIGGDGDNHECDFPQTSAWSDWIDITTDTNAPAWDWSSITSLDCDVQAIGIFLIDSWYVYAIQIQVTYTPIVYAPDITNQNPSDNGFWNITYNSSFINYSLHNTILNLSANITDTDSHAMNITFYFENVSGKSYIEVYDDTYYMLYPFYYTDPLNFGQVYTWGIKVVDPYNSTWENYTFTFNVTDQCSTDVSFSGNNYTNVTEGDSWCNVTSEWRYDWLTNTFKEWLNETHNFETCIDVSFTGNNYTNISSGDSWFNVTSEWSYNWSNDLFKEWLNESHYFDIGNGKCANFSGTYYINHSSDNITLNITVDYNFTNVTCSVLHTHNITNETINDDNWLNISNLLLGTPTIIFMLWVFLVFLGEWKDDWLYKILQLPIGLTYGVTLLSSDIYLGLGLIFASIYILSIAYWQSRKDKKE